MLLLILPLCHCGVLICRTTFWFAKCAWHLKHLEVCYMVSRNQVMTVQLIDEPSWKTYSVILVMVVCMVSDSCWLFVAERDMMFTSISACLQMISHSWGLSCTSCDISYNSFATPANVVMVSMVSMAGPCRHEMNVSALHNAIDDEKKHSGKISF